ncbi:tetratricopeptide repeat protein [uncultured Albimonas sp.]|uniref:tetratricopeptide repeat protein n=1 Tax=uncultured Albimonas sp. TaxID=1331701 RepID=UPI0030EB73D3
MARAEANAAAARGPGPASRRGWALLDSGRAEPASRAFRQALIEEGPTLGTMLGLGAAYRALGRRGPALEVLTRTAEAWPDSPAARNNLGTVLFDIGRLDAAEGQFRAAADLMSRQGLAPSTEVSRNLAMVARARGAPLAPTPEPLPAVVPPAVFPPAAFPAAAVPPASGIQTPAATPPGAPAPVAVRPPVPRPETEA